MTNLLSASQTSTALATLSSDADGSAVSIKSLDPLRSKPVVLIVATSVTTGATLGIEGRNKKGQDEAATEWREIARVAVSASGSKVVPLLPYADKAGGLVPDELRVTTPAYTDGTYTCTLLTHA